MKVFRNNRGSLTVEACISFTLFSMVILTILFLMRIVYVHAVVQHAITQTAKEMSSYSYLYSVSGLDDINDAYVDTTQQGKDYFDGKAEILVNAYESIINVTDSGADTFQSVINKDLEESVKKAKSTVDSYAELREKFPEAINSIKEIADNPMNLVKSIGCIFAGGVLDETKTFLGGELSRVMVASYIADMDAEEGSKFARADKRLKALQVENGIEGLDFSFSRFFSDKKTIDIVVCYKVKPILPINILPEVNLINRISVRGWL